jgi:hypothetical protein
MPEADDTANLAAHRRRIEQSLADMSGTVTPDGLDRQLAAEIVHPTEQYDARAEAWARRYADHVLTAVRDRLQDRRRGISSEDVIRRVRELRRDRAAGHEDQ